MVKNTFISKIHYPPAI